MSEYPECKMCERHADTIAELCQRIAELEQQVADICPVGDLVGIPAWQAEKQHMQERIAELEARLDIGTGNMYDVVVSEDGMAKRKV